jgi:hypothetical protein
MRNRFILTLIFLVLLINVISCSFYTQTSIPDQNGELILIGRSEDTYAWLINVHKKTKAKMKIIGISKEHYFYGITNTEKPDEYYITTFWGEFILFRCRKIERRLYCKKIVNNEIEFVELN